MHTQESNVCPERGCGNHPCDVSTNTGMGPNGHCSCDERTLRRALRWYKKRVIELEVELAKKNASPAEQRMVSFERRGCVRP